MTYTFTFEQEDGLTEVNITAWDYLDACKRLSDTYPEDLGADGFCTYGTFERPICWYRRVDGYYQSIAS